MANIKPGRCPVDECGRPHFPLPTQLDCIEVLKVYDHCFREDMTIATFNIPDKTIDNCEVDFSPGPYQLPHTRCEIISVGNPDEHGCRSIVAKQLVRIRIIFTDGTCVYEDVPPFFSDAYLFSPDGTFAQCELLSARCDCERVPGLPPRVMCRVRVCKTIEVKALVKLLIPSYGFCHPEPCRPTPDHEFHCPPKDIYPPTHCHDLSVEEEEN